MFSISLIYYYQILKKTVFINNGWSFVNWDDKYKMYKTRQIINSSYYNYYMWDFYFHINYIPHTPHIFSWKDVFLRKRLPAENVFFATPVSKDYSHHYVFTYYILPYEQLTTYRTFILPTIVSHVIGLKDVSFLMLSKDKDFWLDLFWVHHANIFVSHWYFFLWKNKWMFSNKLYPITNWYFSYYWNLLRNNYKLNPLLDNINIEHGPDNLLFDKILRLTRHLIHDHVYQLHFVPFYEKYKPNVHYPYYLSKFFGLLMTYKIFVLRDFEFSVHNENLFFNSVIKRLWAISVTFYGQIDSTIFFTGHIIWLSWIRGYFLGGYLLYCYWKYYYKYIFFNFVQHTVESLEECWRGILVFTYQHSLIVFFKLIFFQSVIIDLKWAITELWNALTNEKYIIFFIKLFGISSEHIYFIWCYFNKRFLEWFYFLWEDFLYYFLISKIYFVKFWEGFFINIIYVQFIYIKLHLKKVTDFIQSYIYSAKLYLVYWIKINSIPYFLVVIRFVLFKLFKSLDLYYYIPLLLGVVPVFFAFELVDQLKHFITIVSTTWIWKTIFNNLLSLIDWKLVDLFIPPIEIKLTHPIKSPLKSLKDICPTNEQVNTIEKDLNFVHTYVSDNTYTYAAILITVGVGLLTAALVIASVETPVTVF